MSYEKLISLQDELKVELKSKNDCNSMLNVELIAVIKCEAAVEKKKTEAFFSTKIEGKTQTAEVNGEIFILNNEVARQAFNSWFARDVITALTQAKIAVASCRSNLNNIDNNIAVIKSAIDANVELIVFDTAKLAMETAKLQDDTASKNVNIELMKQKHFNDGDK